MALSYAAGTRNETHPPKSEQLLPRIALYRECRGKVKSEVVVLDGELAVPCTRNPL
jgi:hypothetical protein